MCEAVGHKVISLHRSKIGKIEVKDLEIGKWRYLSKKEAFEGVIWCNLGRSKNTP